MNKNPSNAVFPTIVLICLTFIRAVANPPAEDMAAAANKLLASLDAAQKAKATFDLKADERSTWHYIPKIRKGLTIKDMNPDQRKLAHALLASGLSQRAYSKATNIMSLEPVLRELEAPAGTMVRDQELYYFSIFGKPAPKE